MPELPKCHERSSGNSANRATVFALLALIQEGAEVGFVAFELAIWSGYCITVLVVLSKRRVAQEFQQARRHPDRR